MSKCLSLSQAALLCNNSSYVLLRFDLKSFVKAGPSRRRPGENRLPAWVVWGLREQMTSWIHMASLWSGSSALPSSGPSCLHYLCWSIQCSREAGQGHLEMIFLKLTFKRFEDLQALAGYFWNSILSGGGWREIIVPRKIFENGHTIPFACLNC